MHILGADDDPRPLLEGPVCGERHPVGFEVVGKTDFFLHLGFCHDLSPFEVVMPGLVPGIHDFCHFTHKDVEGRA
jgi:hypothetical protein